MGNPLSNDPVSGLPEFLPLKQEQFERLQIPERHSKPCSERYQSDLPEPGQELALSEHQQPLIESNNPFKMAGERSGGTVSDAVSAYTAYLENKQSEDYKALKTSIAEFQRCLGKMESKEELLSGYDWASEEDLTSDKFTNL